MDSILFMTSNIQNDITERPTVCEEIGRTSKLPCCCITVILLLQMLVYPIVGTAQSIHYPIMIVQMTDDSSQKYIMNNDLIIRKESQYINISGNESENLILIDNIKSIGFLLKDPAFNGLDIPMNPSGHKWTIYDPKGILIDSGEDSNINFSKLETHKIYIIHIDRLCYKYMRLQ